MLRSASLKMQLRDVIYDSGGLISDLSHGDGANKPDTINLTDGFANNISQMR